MKGFRSIDLTDKEWGTIKLLIVIPQPEEPWGELAPLKDTVWGEQVAVVSGENISHALHGWATPLMRTLGGQPEAKARRINLPCVLRNQCIGFKINLCRPGPSTPDCYQAPNPKKKGVPHEEAFLIGVLVMAWREGRYVVVVSGSEFSFPH